MDRHYAEEIDGDVQYDVMRSVLPEFLMVSLNDGFGPLIELALSSTFVITISDSRLVNREFQPISVLPELQFLNHLMFSIIFKRS